MTENNSKTWAPGILHAIPECLPAMMHSIDAQGVIVWVSDRWLEVMGHERAQVLGRKSTDFLGEEFAVCLPQTGAEATVRVAERFREAVATRPVGLRQGVDLHISVSLGVASLNAPMDSLDDLLKRADTALYRAKSGGRNRCVAG